MEEEIHNMEKMFEEISDSLKKHFKIIFEDIEKERKIQNWNIKSLLTLAEQNLEKSQRNLLEKELRIFDNIENKEKNMKKFIEDRLWDHDKLTENFFLEEISKKEEEILKKCEKINQNNANLNNKKYEEKMDLMKALLEDFMKNFEYEKFLLNQDQETLKINLNLLQNFDKEEGEVFLFFQSFFIIY